MGTGGLFSWAGGYFSVPGRGIIPRRVQKPHPPLWVTASNPDTVERAARLGLGVALFSFSDPERLAPLVDTYKNAIATADPVGAFVHDKIMAICPLLCLDDAAEARRIYAAGMGAIAPHFTVYFDTIPHNFARFADEPRPVPQTRLREMIAEATRDPDLRGPMAFGDPSPEFFHQNGICVGGPEEVLATMRRYRDIGIDQLVTCPAAIWNETHEVTLESIRLTGEKVIPELR